jgi:hypothetical protein
MQIPRDLGGGPLEQLLDHGSTAPAAAARSAGAHDLGVRTRAAGDRVLDLTGADGEAVTDDHPGLPISRGARAQLIW